MLQFLVSLYSRAELDFVAKLAVKKEIASLESCLLTEVLNSVAQVRSEPVELTNASLG